MVQSMQGTGAPEGDEARTPPAEAGQPRVVRPPEEADKTLDKVLSATPAPIYLFDREGRCLYASHAGATALGLSQGELVGKTWRDLGVPPSIRDPFDSALRGVFDTGHSFTGETELAAGEERRYFQYSLSPICGPSGSADTVVATFSDITERRKATMALGEALARAEAARKEAEAAGTRFHALLENAPDGIVLVDGNGLIAMVNTQAEKLTAYRREELIGKPVEILVPDRYRERHVGHRVGYMAEPRTRPMGVGLDLYLRRSDGTEVPVEISLSPLQVEEGVLVTAVIRDISGRKHAEQEIRRLNEDLSRRAADLEAINREMEAFSYSVSHDLRAPLRLIDGFSQALLEDYQDKLDDEGKEYLTWVRQSVQQMAGLIDDLLRLSRIGRAEMRTEDVDLSALAREVARELQQRDPARQVEWVIAPDLHATGDAPLLRVVLENLMGNAWKFTGKRAGARIEFGVTAHDGRPAYYVRDNGAGFDMAYASKLFTPFQRLHSAEEFPGSGIGLALVQRVIHRHGGQVWAEGAVGQGATFYFTLAPGTGGS